MGKWIVEKKEERGRIAPYIDNNVQRDLSTTKLPFEIALKP